MNEGLPCSLFLYHLLAVGQFHQVFTDHINPPRGGSTSWPFWSALQEVTRGDHQAFFAHDQTTSAVFCLTCSSIGNSPVSFRMSAFLHMSHKVIPRISRLMWKVLSFLVSCCVTGHATEGLTSPTCKSPNLSGLAQAAAADHLLPPQLVHHASLPQPYYHLSFHLTVQWKISQKKISQICLKTSILWY